MKKYHLFPIAIIFLVIISVFLYGDYDKTCDFWTQLNISKKDVDEVVFVYRNQKVAVDAAVASDFLETLSSSEPKNVEDSHEFIPSDIDVILNVGGEEYELKFYWFPYQQNIKSGMNTVYTSENQNFGAVMDRRFDVKIDEKIYHYSFTTEKVWTEALMHQTYDKSAEEQGLLKMHQLLGGDYRWNEQAYMTNDVYSLTDIIDQSDMIFLGTYITRAENESANGADSYIQSVEIFQVDEVLKGKYRDQYYRMPSEHQANQLNIPVESSKFVTVVFDSVVNPQYISERQYVVCVKDLEKKTDQVNNYFEQYGTAILDGDTLFPRYNTENHPFYNVKLLDLKREINR